MSAKDLPPPIRKPKRRLSLKTAIAALSRAENTSIVEPLMDPVGEFPAMQDGKQQEIEANLLELQADIIIREGLLSDKEKQLQNRERELNEKEALLEAHRKILVSNAMPAKKQNDVIGQVDGSERQAFNELKKELVHQEATLKEARRMLLERELFIEQCENELVDKSMLLTEREARVEQREEDHEAKKFVDGVATQGNEAQVS